MKRYLDIVPISEKVHKKQNRMSICCIVLAVFLVTTIFGMADMFIRSQISKTQAEAGNWHISFQNISNETATIIAERPEVKVLSPYSTLNYQGEQNYTLNGENTSIFGTDKNLINEIFSGMLSEGAFPQMDTEALITENAQGMLGLNIGDQITIGTPNGNKHIFTVSGILGNASNLMRNDLYGVFVTIEAFQTLYFDGNSGEPTEYTPDHYFAQFSSTRDIQSKIAALKSQVGLSDEQVSENTKLLGLLGQSSNSLMLQVYASATVLFVLVLISGIMMITSSLNSNVAQRTEFFGLMRCIGATPKQVMRLVRKEALNWCRFAIPIGIVGGVILIWVLCFILRYLSPKYFVAMPVFSVSVPSIIAGAVMGILTVLLAARSPAKKASKVSPLSAVSGNANNLQPVRKAANTKLFHVDVALGIHHAKASRKNFILMMFSFALSIILFLAFSVTVEFINRTLTPLYPWTADISIVSQDKTCSVNRAFVEELKANPAVEKVYGRMFAYNVPTMVNSSQKTVDIVSYEEYQFEWSKKYLSEGDLETVQNEVGTGLIVYEPQNVIQVGDTVSVNINGQTAEIKIVGMLSTSPFNNAADVGTIVCSEDTFIQLTGQSDYTIIDMQMSANATDNDVNAIHTTYGNGYSFVDERMDNESTIGIYYCMWLFVYGFLVLIAFITVLNVINSIAMSVAARTKQYGAFRAIGLSNRQLSKMVIAEAFSYTIAGSVIGVILGMICNKALFSMLVTHNWGDPWTVPWIEMFIIIFIVLLSVFWAVYSPIKRLHNMSIVDTISAQ